ncbi:MAG: hypothetical protein J6H31_11500 [Butyrivibrio sp.]|nr:hypothetical protein [Butyrivibrio sp.]
MAKLIDCDITQFLKKYSKRSIFVIGVGRIFQKFFEYFPLGYNVIYAADNDIQKQGNSISAGGINVEIKSIDDIEKDYDGSQIILITNLSSLVPIMEQLCGYTKLEEALCFHASMMMDRCKKGQVDYIAGKQRIPKKIHYCWFGDKPIPEEYQECIDSWKKYCPDYEIIRWNENNYDITKKRYMREAYEKKQWGFVPDYARLDIIYEYGGIYFDTDIEIIRSFDKLLTEGAFFGFHNYVEINPGLGFGAQSKHPFIKELMEQYDDKRFIKDDGSIDNRTCISYSQHIFKSHGFVFDNTLQRHDDVTVFPTEVFNPTGALGINNLFSDNTFSFNHSARSWDTPSNHNDYDKIKNGEWKKFV